MSSVMGLYYRIGLMRETDFTWNMPPVMTLASVTPIFCARREGFCSAKLTGRSIVEMNVGIICGCMPHLAAFFRQHPIKSSHLSPFRRLASRLGPKLSKRSFFAEKGSDDSFDRVASQTPPNNHYLGTQILESSAQGEGKFLQSGEWERHGWLDQSASASAGQGQATYREVWDCRV